MNKTPCALARAPGVYNYDVNDVLLGHCGISGDLALRLEAALGSSTGFLISLQATYERRKAETVKGEATRVPCSAAKHAATAALLDEIQCFAPAWMWDPATSPEYEVERLRLLGCAHFLLAYMPQTRDRWIDSPEHRKFRNVLYRGLLVVEYERKY